MQFPYETEFKSAGIRLLFSIHSTFHTLIDISPRNMSEFSREIGENDKRNSQCSINKFLDQLLCPDLHQHFIVSFLNLFYSFCINLLTNKSINKLTDWVEYIISLVDVSTVNSKLEAMDVSNLLYHLFFLFKGTNKLKCCVWT